MKRYLATLLVMGTLGCGSSDGVGDDPSLDGKEDRPSVSASATDRGEIVVGTSRRARFTEAGQTHRFELALAAGAAIRLDAMPAQANEGSLKTTMSLFGPVGAGGALPRQAIASTDDGTFSIHETVAAAGEYVIVVGTAKRSMTGTYDLYAACENLACHPSPVALRAREASAALKAVAEAVECEDVSWCDGDASAFTYDEGTARPDAAAIMEAVLKKLATPDSQWGTLEERADPAALGVDEKVTAAGLVDAARRVGGDGEVEAFHVDGVVMFAVDDSGTDGWDEHLYVLHFPASRSVVALHVRK
jgi:hypothetical protein